MLPVVHVEVAADGGINVDVDGTPHDAGRALERAHLRSLLDQLTVELDSPVRVEIQEHRPISREKRWIVTRLISRPVEE